MALKIHERHETEKATAKAELEELARAKGFSIAALFGDAKPAKGKSKGTVPPKYRNPDNPEQTWTGRGRQPGWIKAALEKGQTLEDMAI